MKKIYLILIILLLLNCSTKKYYYPFNSYRKGNNSITLKNATLKITDSINVELFGKIIYNKGTLPYADIILINIESKKKYNKTSDDESGSFRFNIPSGTYKLKIYYIGLSTFEDSLNLKKGEVRELNIEMKDAGGCTSNVIVSNKKLSAKELGKAIKQSDKIQKQN